MIAIHRQDRRHAGLSAVQLGHQLVGITQQVLKGEFAGVVEIELEAMIDHRLDGLGIEFAI